MSEWGKIPSYPTCFVCGKNNPIGLGLIFRANGDMVEADFEPKMEHCGYEGIVHGGIVCAVLDEGMGWTGWLKFGKYYLTMELNVRLRKSIRSGKKYLFRGKFIRRIGNIYIANGEIIDCDGVVMASGEGKYFIMND